MCITQRQYGKSYHICEITVHPGDICTGSSAFRRNSFHAFPVNYCRRAKHALPGHCQPIRGLSLSSVTRLQPFHSCIQVGCQFAGDKLKQGTKADTHRMSVFIQATPPLSPRMFHCQQVPFTVYFIVGQFGGQYYSNSTRDHVHSKAIPVTEGIRC